MPITLRDTRVVYYGPHACDNCGELVARAGREWGGAAFTWPPEPIYPNTVWTAHVCDPHMVSARLAKEELARRQSGGILKSLVQR